MRTLLRFFFRLLYHPFAFTYDLVAATVSFGRWKDWIMEVVPFIEGTRILELGHGPGHLQRIILSRSLPAPDRVVAVGLDESPQMGRLAKRNTQGSARLTRGVAQHLPFASRSFDTILATFPTEYFADPSTLEEVKRCLEYGGRFIVLPAAIPKNPLLSWLFKVTAQAPSEALKIIRKRLEEPFLKADFHVETHVLDLKSGRLILIVATISR